MILGFKQQFPWKEPTYFREKILAGAGYGPIVSMPKIHTMREDPYNRWKAGMSIQMAYGVRTKNYEQFNKGITELEKCVSTQAIKIIWFYKNEYIKTDLPLKQINGPHGEFNYYPAIWIDGRQLLTFGEIITLAHNDGFDSVIDFFKWFNRDWSGKIIHWTDFRY